MPRITIRVEGQQDTIRRINIFDQQKKDKAAEVVKKHAAAVRKSAKKSVPVSPSSRKKSAGSPGDLKKSIRAKYYFDGLGAMVLPNKPKGTHRHLVEYGTGNRRWKNGKSTGKMSPQPFMEPAKRAQEAKYNREMEQIWENGDTTV